VKRSAFVVGLVFLIFFVISLITNILGSLIPDIKADFGLSYALAGFLPMSFFLAYGVSIPAGMLIERFREKPVLLSAFLLACLGSFLFATLPVYAVALGSLFVIGIGMAMLQVAINPLLRVAGGEEHFAFFSVMAQLVFGAASGLSPHLYSYLVQSLQAGPPHTNALVAGLAGVVPTQMPWVSLYWVFAVVALGMLAMLALVRLPVVELKEEEKVGAFETTRRLLRNRFVVLYFLGIFMYVGTEQGVANWISEFLRAYHGLDPVTGGAQAVSGFWWLMTLGCVVGLGLLKLFDSRRVLVAFSVAAIVALSFALFGPAAVAFQAFQLVGFCLSVMWSIVFSLALNSLDRHHGSFSGILCTGIVGGAMLPPLIGWLSDRVGLRFGMVVLYLTLGYILAIGFWAKPLVTNATIFRRREAGAGGS
jgi:fucose permease